MMRSKNKSQNSHSKSRKKIRENNSYKIQFKTKIKQKSKYQGKEQRKNMNKNIHKNYFNSNISAKELNKKQVSSILKEYKSFSKTNFNNNLSYSNYIVNEVEKSNKNEDNTLSECSKNNNEEYINSLSKRNNGNSKMDIKELSNINNNKIIAKKDNKSNVNKSLNKKLNKEFKINKCFKKAACSMMNENEKYFENLTFSDDNNKNKYKSALKENEQSKKDIDFNEIEFEKKIRKKELEQYITSNNSFKKKKSKNQIKKNDDFIQEENKKENDEYIQNNNNEINSINNQLNEKIIKHEEKNNLNGEEITQTNILLQKIQNLKLQKASGNNENIELYKELGQKLDNLYNKIHRINEESKVELPENNNNDFQSQITYHNLKRYRKKSEPNLRNINIDSDNNNLNINTMNYKRKKSANNLQILPPKLIMTTKPNENENENLPKLIKLKDKIKPERCPNLKLDILLGSLYLHLFKTKK